MTNRYLRTIEVADLVSYDEEADIPLADAIATLQKALADIPEEHRAKAVLHMRASGDYASLSADVRFTREETDQELAQRLAEEQNYRAQSEQRERAEFERLKQKFGR